MAHAPAALFRLGVQPQYAVMAMQSWRTAEHGQAGSEGPAVHPPTPLHSLRAEQAWWDTQRLLTRFTHPPRRPMPPPPFTHSLHSDRNMVGATDGCNMSTGRSGSGAAWVTAHGGSCLPSGQRSSATRNGVACTWGRCSPLVAGLMHTACGTRQPVAAGGRRPPAPIRNLTPRRVPPAGWHRVRFVQQGVANDWAAKWPTVQHARALSHPDHGPSRAVCQWKRLVVGKATLPPGCNCAPCAAAGQQRR